MSTVGDLEPTGCTVCGSLVGHLRDCGEKPAKVTEAAIIRALARRYMRERNGVAPKWIFAAQVTVGTSFGMRAMFPHEEPMPVALACGANQRIDAFALNCWQSGRGERHAFEIKCSRADLRHELLNPLKREAAMALSTHFYFVLDRAIRYDDLPMPADCGIMVHDGGSIRIKRQAERRHAEAPPYLFMLSLMRSITLGRAER